MEDIHVIKRNGDKQSMSFDKILKRIQQLGTDIHDIKYSEIVIKIINQLHDNISTSKIDIITADYCISCSTINPNYSTLANRIIISNHHKNTPTSFYEVMFYLYPSVISSEFWNIVQDNHLNGEIKFDDLIDYSRDYLLDFFGFKTLEKSYLFKTPINNKIVERPQHMWMRVAIHLHKNNIPKVKETYDLLSQKYFIHATPTLFNAGLTCAQLSSCFLLGIESDSLDGIFNTIKECANISKYSGGIGVHIHNVRGTNSKISSINGISNGIVPMLRVFNNVARYINQGGKRNGSYAVYLEPWHIDIQAFLEMKTNRGDEESKARDLFYALWVPDLFMQRVKEEKEWTLMCPSVCTGLDDVYGEEFEKLYTKYESDKSLEKSMIRISARDLWYKILDTQMETGIPYILYKDACNKKSNQKNIGTIKSSNLCTEIIEFSNESESAVCNLASIALPMFVNQENKTFDYLKLHEVSKIVTNNLNIIIDINYYPDIKTRNSNTLNRPIGIGVQGLADVFLMLGLSFSSREAKEINKNIFETIYHGALEMSMELSKEHSPYARFSGSPASLGILQFDLWDNSGVTDSRHNWTDLKEKIKINGLYNSLLLAPMPTASTSQILGFNECFEPITSNIYTRGTMAGEFIVVNKYLIKEFIEMGFWNESIKNSIIKNKGSVQHLSHIISQIILDKYKTVWEMSMKDIIDMSADRGAFICQSQSLNLWLTDPTYTSLTNMHFYAWKKGLKTGIYYLRRRAKHTAQQFTIEPEKNECLTCSS